MKDKKNFISSLLVQIPTILSGLIVPRLILSGFGSETNGLISSITQFLNFITLLEGGLGAVVLAEYYKPICDNDKLRVGAVYKACKKLFTQIGVVFILYTIILGLIYPKIIKTSFSYTYILTLVYILSFSTLIQYLFSVSLRFIIQAHQDMYVVNTISGMILSLNMGLVFILIKIGVSIHFVKLISSMLFILQPLIYTWYIKNRTNYSDYLVDEFESIKLDNRWSGFSQNLAHFVNMNTDVALITLLCDLKAVSVYNIYMLPMNALRQIVITICNSMQSSLGNAIVSLNLQEIRSKYDFFRNINLAISTLLFCPCMLLINGFVRMYTNGVNDTNYYAPLFSIIMVMAQYIYCCRESDRFLILSSGKFKETNKCSIMEAILNLSISFVFLRMGFGLIGVAVGTLIAISYRYIYFICFLRKNIIFENFKAQVKSILPYSFIVLINVLIYMYVDIQILNIFDFCIYGIVFSALNLIMVLLINFKTIYNYLNSKRKVNG